jgi:predicted ATPase with chaperone activity
MLARRLPAILPALSLEEALVTLHIIPIPPGKCKTTAGLQRAHDKFLHGRAVAASESGLPRIGALHPATM